MSSWSEPGWRENTVYPGTHWLYYDERGNYKARIDLHKWNNGLYEWRVMYYSYHHNDDVGWEESLEAAKEAAEKVMRGEPHQLMLRMCKE